VSPGSRAIVAGLGFGPRWAALLVRRRRDAGSSRRFAGPPAAGILREPSITGTKRSTTGRYRDLTPRGLVRPLCARVRGVSANRYDYRGQARPGRYWHATQGHRAGFALAKADSKSASCPGITGSNACSEIMSASSPGIGPGPHPVQVRAHAAMRYAGRAKTRYRARGPKETTATRAAHATSLPPPRAARLPYPQTRLDTGTAAQAPWKTRRGHSDAGSTLAKPGRGAPPLQQRQPVSRPPHVAKTPGLARVGSCRWCGRRCRTLAAPRPR
jgi:hypothetical protein